MLPFLRKTFVKPYQKRLTRGSHRDWRLSNQALCTGHAVNPLTSEFEHFWGKLRAVNGGDLTSAGKPSPGLDVADYEGVRVACDPQRWAQKIDANHPELTGKQAEVAEAIANPEIVLRDRDYPERRHFIRRNVDALYIVAVVEYRYAHGLLTGHLVTAFVRSRLRSDDQVLYVNVRR